MHSHELLREVFEKVNPKQCAAELGLSLSMVYKWAEAPGQSSGATNPLDRVASLMEITKDERIVHWVCQKAGGFFINNPKASWTHPFFVVPATNRIVQEFADLLSVVASAASDHHITKKEAANIRGRWEELKTVTEGFVRCCEEGNFTPINNECPKEPATPTHRPQERRTQA